MGVGVVFGVSIEIVVSFTNADAGMATSMWWIMTIPIGKCMPLEGVLHPLSIAKATDFLHLITDSAKRWQTLPGENENGVPKRTSPVIPGVCQKAVLKALNFFSSQNQPVEKKNDTRYVFFKTFRLLKIDFWKLI